MTAQVRRCRWIVFRGDKLFDGGAARRHGHRPKIGVRGEVTQAWRPTLLLSRRWSLRPVLKSACLSVSVVAETNIFGRRPSPSVNWSPPSLDAAIYRRLQLFAI